MGGVAIGGNSPVRIQSMTNTDTADIGATVTQVVALAKAGSELVRITVNNEAAAMAVPEIRAGLEAAEFGAVPLIGDFHYNGHLLLRKFPKCAQALDKYRINPGNVGSGELHEKNFAVMIAAAVEYMKPVRIGVNWGSVDQELLTKMMEENGGCDNGITAESGGKIPRGAPKSDAEVLREALVESALTSARRAESLGLPANKIILSVKTSDVQEVIATYEMLASRCDYALHLGLTEAGMGARGLISSAAALAVLLQRGIGDTIRFSLTPAPGATMALEQDTRTQEVEACQLLLQTMGLRQFRPLVTSCPGCGRTSSDRFQHLAKEVNAHLAQRMPEWQTSHPKAVGLKVAVMGCTVNGPGEAQHADIALSLPGKSEEPIATVFVQGKLLKTLRGESLGKEFISLIDDYVATHC